MSVTKFIELNPYYATLSVDDLVSIPVKNITGLISDKEPVYRRGRKVMKRWYTSEIDRLKELPSFCKTYTYDFNEQGELTIITKCQWFNTDEELLEERIFTDDHTVQATDYITQGHRETLISRLRSDAKGVEGVNGEGDAVTIFKRYKNQVQSYIFDKNAASDWVEALENEDINNILNFLNVIIPTLWEDNMYEYALNEKTLLSKVLKEADINPLKEDYTFKSISDLAVELFQKGVDITGGSQESMMNMISFLNSSGKDIRLISIRDVIINLITTE